MGLLSEVLESAAIVERDTKRDESARSLLDVEADVRALVAELLDAHGASPPPDWSRRKQTLLLELRGYASIEMRAELEFAGTLALAAERVDAAALATRRQRLRDAGEHAAAALDVLDASPPTAALAVAARVVRANASARRARVARSAAMRWRERVDFTLDMSGPIARLDVDARDAAELEDALGALFACGRAEAELAPFGEWVVAAVELFTVRSCRVDVEREHDRLRVAITRARGDDGPVAHAIALLDAIDTSFHGLTGFERSVSSVLGQLCGRRVFDALAVELQAHDAALTRLRELNFCSAAIEPTTSFRPPPPLLRLARELAARSPRTTDTVERSVVTCSAVELREAIWALLAVADPAARLSSFETAKRALELFCELIQPRVDEPVEPSPYDLAVCYNDCIYCVQTMNGPPWSKTLAPDYARFVHMQFIASARSVNTLSILKLSTFVKKQQAILEKIVLDSELNNLEYISRTGSSSEVAVKNCLAKLMSLQKHWKPVFEKQLYEKVMSELTGCMCRSLVNVVLTIKEKIIGECMAFDLANVYQPVVSAVPILFHDKTNVEKLCVQFSRLSKLIWILKTPLFSIASAWKRSGDDLSKYFTSDEIKHFIRVLHPSSNQKSTALNMIQ